MFTLLFVFLCIERHVVVSGDLNSCINGIERICQSSINTLV